MTRSTKPTVALVAHGIHRQGGMERAFAELVLRAHDDFDFVLLAADVSEEVAELATWHRVRVPMRPISVKSPCFSVVAGAKLARVDAQLVHTMGAVVPNRVDIASVHFCHAGHREFTGKLGPSDAPLIRRMNTATARRIALATERWCYRPGRVKLLTSVSAGVTSELRRHYPRIPVTATPNGVDAERVRPDEQARGRSREEYGAGPDAIVMLFVGGDWDHKGVGVAIEGMAEAGRRTDRDLRLWVVGTGDERRFRALAARHGVADRVAFSGWQSTPETFYRSADVFILPTLYETFSLAAHEAAAAGLPVVATRVHGVDELIGDDRAGLIVDRTAQSVASAIARIADDDQLRRDLSAEAMARARSFTWARSVDSVLAAYETVLSGRTRTTEWREALAGNGTG